MKKVIAFLAMIAIIVGIPMIMGCGTTGTYTVGTIQHPDGSVTRNYVERDDRLFHHEQAKYLSFTDKAKLVSEPKPHFVANTELVSDPQAVGGMAWGGKGAAGFISNLPNTSIIPAAALVRPSNTSNTSNTNVSSTGGTAAGGAGGVGIGGTGVGIGGAGGAGGAGGNAAINNTGGVGNTQTINNDANGNGTILGGNIY